MSEPMYEAFSIGTGSYRGGGGRWADAAGQSASLGRRLIKSHPDAQGGKFY